MIGYYRVYKDGQLVVQSPNVITEEGRKMIIRYLAGSVGSWAGAIAVGAGTSSPTIEDTQLDFEFGRSDVQLRSPRPNELQVVLRTTMDPSISGNIYETGLYNTHSNSMTSYPRIVLTTFDPFMQTITGGVIYQGNEYARAGGIARRLNPTAGFGDTVYVSELATNLAGYGPDDTFTLAANFLDPNTEAISVRFQMNDENYFEHIFDGGIGEGYQLLTVRKGDFVSTGGPSWDNIQNIRIEARAGATDAVVYLDGLSADDRTTYPEYTLISRSVLSTPIHKEANEEVDIEYVLEFS